MEDTLRVIFWDEDVPGLIVLILVLMEDTLREPVKGYVADDKGS